MLEQFKVAKQYFDGLRRNQMAYGVPTNINLEQVSVEMLMVLGSALWLTKCVTEEDSIKVTGRQSWEMIHKKSRRLVEDRLKGGELLSVQPDSYDFESAYRVLEHLILSAEKPVR